MNKIQRYVVASLLCSMSIISSFAQIIGTDLIAYYPLHSGYKNSANQLENLASNNYHLTPNVSPVFVASRNGAQNTGNGALALTGGTMQLNYDYSSNAAPFQIANNFAIGAWATTTIPSFTNEYQNMVVVGNNDIFIRYRKNGTTYSIQAGIRTGANNFSVLNYDILSPSNFFEDTWGNPAWHHFALHRGGGVMELYVDGVNVANSMTGAPIFHSSSNQSFKIGYGPTINGHLTGKISDVFYYARALDPLDFSRITCDKLSVSPISQEYAYCNAFGGVLISTSPAGATNVQWYTTPFDGTPIHTGNSLSVASMNTTTTYYVDASYSGGCTQKSYPRARIKVNINSAASQPTNTTPAANLTICGGSSTTLSASTVNSYVQWYDAPTGGNLVGTGNSYTTPTLNTTTSYYAESVSLGCGSSSRIAIQVNVTPTTPPAAPTILSTVFTVCGNNPINLIANTPGTTIRWYTAATGGTLLHTGTNYLTPALPNPSAYGVEDTYTYYVESSTTCGGSSVRVPVTFTVKYQYSLSAVNPTVTVCSGTPATLTINTNAPQNITSWFSNFTTVATNTFTVTTPPITSMTSYDATIQPANGCGTSVNFLISTTTAQAATPTNTTSPSNLMVCNGSSTTVSANGSQGVSWYDASSSGNLLGTGASFVTPNLTINTTFYAQNGAGSCASTRIPVLVTVNQPATGIATHSACGSFTWINGNTYNNSNTTATHTIANGAVNGCDSIVTLNLTINQAATSTVQETACNSFVWTTGNGQTYTSSTTAAHTLANAAANGCDSIVTLQLTINNATFGTDVQTSCGSFTWIDGITYHSDNTTATHVIPAGASTGCDSIVQLNLEVLFPATNAVFETVCDSYTWTLGDGQTYTQTGNHDFIIAGGAANGCDSIVTLVLTVTEINTGTTVVGETIGANQNNATYQWLNCDDGNSTISRAQAQTFSPTVTGNYAVAITLNGCTETSACQNVIVSDVGIDDLNSLTLNIYPNPANEMLTIEVDQAIEIQLMSQQGAVLQNVSLIAGINTLPIEMLANGVYFIHTNNGKTLKFVKSN